MWRMLYDVILNVNIFQRDSFEKGIKMNPLFHLSYSLGGFIFPFKVCNLILIFFLIAYCYPYNKLY